MRNLTPLTVTNPNNHATLYGYDTFGRLTKIARPGDSLTIPTVAYTYTDAYTYNSLSGIKIEERYLEVSGNAALTRPLYKFYNGLGQLVQERAETQDNSQVAVANYVYNAAGQLATAYQPAFESGSGSAFYDFNRPSGWDTRPKTTTTYDGLGRVTVVTAPDGTTTQSSYGLDTTTNYGITTPTGLLLQAVTDANDHYRQQITDPLGRLVVVREFTGTAPSNLSLYATTRYGYDVADRLVAVTDTLGAVTTIEYNQLGQKIGMHDPDMGDWTYDYDPAGQLITQTDALDQVLWFNYDALGRLTEKRVGGAAGAWLAGYTYGTSSPNKGLLTLRADPYSASQWIYDARGRVLTETKTITGTGTYTTAFGYDALDRPIITTLPTNEVITQTYNAAGLPKDVRSITNSQWYGSAMQYNASGQLTSILLGNGVQTTNSYHAQTGALLSTLSAKVPETPLLSLSYLYDDVGNITRITDTTRSEITNYAYDPLDRLTWITTTLGANTTQQTYLYGPTGNILSVGRWPNTPSHSGVGGLAGAISAAGPSRGGVSAFINGSAADYFMRGGGPVVIPSSDPVWTQASYEYDDPAHVHAVTRVSNGGYFTYDANGNMTQRVEGGQSYVQTFDVENRLTQVVANGAQTSTYFYDAHGAMLKRVRHDDTATIYVGLVEYELNQGGSVTSSTSYYNLPGARVVRSAAGVFWVLTDHLGSSSVTVDASGDSVVGTMRYEAYGATRVSTGDAQTDKLYTGQRSEWTGLYFYNARWYSPYLNRWVQPDTIVPNPVNPQDLNRYTYVRASPLKYTDPTGHCLFLAGIDTLGCALAYSAIAATLTLAWAIGDTYGWGAHSVHNRDMLASSIEAMMSSSSGNSSSTAAGGSEAGKFGSFDPNDPSHRRMFEELLREHNQNNANSLSDKTLERMLEDIRTRTGTGDVRYSGQNPSGGGADFPQLRTDITTSFQKAADTYDDAWWGLRDAISGKVTQADTLYMQMNTATQYDLQAMLNSVMKDVNLISARFNAIYLYDAEGNLLASWLLMAGG